MHHFLQTQIETAARELQGCNSHIGRNDDDRKLPFDRVIDFNWETARYTEDTRYPYPERRFVALGCIDDKLHVLCFTPIFDGIRVISFRKANLREVKRYEHQTINK